MSEGERRRGRHEKGSISVSKNGASSVGTGRNDPAAKRDERFAELMDKLAKAEEASRELTQTVKARAETISVLTASVSAGTAAMNEQTRTIDAQSKEIEGLRAAADEQAKYLNEVLTAMPPDIEPTLVGFHERLKGVQATLSKLFSAVNAVPEANRELAEHAASTASRRTIDGVDRKLNEMLIAARNAGMRNRSKWDERLRLLRWPLKFATAGAALVLAITWFPGAFPGPVRVVFATTIMDTDAWGAGNQLMRHADPVAYRTVRDMMAYLMEPDSGFQDCFERARAEGRPIECKFPLIVQPPPTQVQPAKRVSPFHNRRTTFREL